MQELCSTLSTEDEDDNDGKELEEEQALEISHLPSLPLDDMTAPEVLPFIYKRPQQRGAFQS